MMRKMFPLACLVALLTVPAAFAAEGGALESDLFAPEPLQTAVCTACGGNYTTSPGGGAASHWGMGSSCSTAQSDLTTQTRAAATSFCLSNIDDYPSCSLTVVVTAACYWNGSMYQVDGYANFKCRYWVGGPGCIIP